MKQSKKIERYLKSNIIASLVTGAVVFLIVLLFSYLNFFEQVELKIFDYKMVKSAKTLKPDSSIVLVAIDQKSLDFFEDNGVSWPWPREFYGYMLNYLSTAGAKAVFFDIDFSSSEIERVEVDASQSKSSFANAIDLSGNVVLSMSLTNVAKKKENNEILDKHLIKHFKNNFNIENFNNAILPLLPFQKASKRLGVVNIETDNDGIVRRVPLFYGYNKDIIPSASLALFSVVENINKSNLGRVVSNIVLDSEKKLLINWYGAGGPGETFPYYSIHSLIVSATKVAENMEPDLPLNIFKDKIIIVGGNAFGLLDYRPVPFSSEEIYPGMEIYATVLSNLKNDHFITQLPDWSELIFILLIAFFSSFLFLKYPNIIRSIISFVVLILIMILLNNFLFYQFRINVSLIAPEVAILIAFVFSGYINYIKEGKQKREIKKIFSRYISPQVVNELLKNYEKVELGGKEVEATVFFSDIKNFTTISENLTAKELVYHLNNYFALASGVILEHKAMLDKYIGDSIMAIFGEPVNVDNHALTACIAALQIQRILKDDYENNARPGAPHFETRIGLNTGSMIVGNIGSNARTDYTAIGDSVNIASRLEGINKIYGTQIIISDTTYELVKDKIVVRELDKIIVKGKENTIKIFELIAEKGSETELTVDKIKLFESGLIYYRKQNWVKAKEIFNDVLEIEPNDKPSKVYIDRCNDLANENLPTDWDGVFVAQTK